MLGQRIGVEASAPGAPSVRLRVPWRGPPVHLDFPNSTQAIRIIADTLIINIVLFLAFLMHHTYVLTFVLKDGADTGGEAPRQFLNDYVREFVGTSFLITILLIATFAISGCYSYGRAYQTRHKLVVIVQAVTFTFVLAGMLAFLVPSGFAMPRSVLLIAGAFSIVVFPVSRLWSAAWRYVVHAEDRTPTSARSIRQQDTIVLVIGGAGYIGSALLPRLLDQGYRVRVLDLFLYGTDPLQGVPGHPALETIRADFRQVDSLIRAMRGVDQVVHLGGIVGDPACAVDEDLTIDINLAATRLIAEVAKGSGIRRFLFASTCSVYGASNLLLNEKSELNPLSLYAKSKIAAETVIVDLADSNFTPVIARFATIFGLSGRTRFDLVVNLLTAKAILDGEITVLGGDQWRPFLHVDDAAHALQMLLRMPTRAKAEILNVGSSRENYTIQQVAELIKRCVPDARISHSTDTFDQRDYRVDFTKIERLVRL